MAKALVDDDLWKLIEPLIPVKPRRKRHPGRKPVDNRKALTGILYLDPYCKFAGKKVYLLAV